MPDPIDQFSRKLLGLEEFAAKVNAQTDSAEKKKRPHAKKIKGSIGPFQTVCSTRDGGVRQIEIVKVTPFAIIYRLKGRTDEYTLPHEVGYLKAVSVKARVETGPRTGRISRSVGGR